MKGPEDQIDEILTNWLTGTASHEELQVLKDWASQDEANLELMETLKKAWNEKNAEPILVNAEDRINEIWQKGNLKKKERDLRRIPLFKYAAAAILLVGSSFGIFHWTQIGETPQVELPASVPSYVLRENKAGQKTKITLPDGTIAYLNSSSSIKFINGFIGNERRVVLEGEAFFEVAKDKSKPFVVESRTVETIALGTAFNVNAFDDSEVVRVSLVEGEVKVNQIGNNDKTVILNPGWELVIVPETRSFLEMPFNLDEVTGWKDGKLVFNNASLEEVTRRLERWYGVHIQVRGNVPANWKVSTVYEDQSLKNVLIDLQYSKKFAYEIDESKITISF
ncbi:FecR family protein [Algoriphagus terrigena]|uniref:FecR family protein n=1 Tax=Algoriphagus terrigena TaxID=344884 RepID=UPI00042404B3|nr:FecR domain-containing protein [Algoriphagus terrigena]